MNRGRSRSESSEVCGSGIVHSPDQYWIILEGTGFTLHCCDHDNLKTPCSRIEAVPCASGKGGSDLKETTLELKHYLDMNDFDHTFNCLRKAVVEHFCRSNLMHKLLVNMCHQWL